jgi:hypothetical protein
MTEITMTASGLASRFFVLGFILGVIIALSWPSASSLVYYFVKGFIRKVVKDIEKEDNGD